MIESELDPVLEQIVRAARQPVAIDPDAKVRLLAAIRAEPLPVRRPSGWSWLTDRRVMLSPLGTLAVAAGLVAIGVGLGAFADSSHSRRSTEAQRLVASAVTRPVADTVVKEVFVLVAPQARHVSVVGDFNQWNTSATPLVRAEKNGPWMVTLPLGEGRHVYSFVVDGRWTSDPSAPLAPDDGFGHANSVIVVSGGAAL